MKTSLYIAIACIFALCSGCQTHQAVLIHAWRDKPRDIYELGKVKDNQKKEQELDKFLKEQGFTVTGEWEHRSGAKMKKYERIK